MKKNNNEAIIKECIYCGKEYTDPSPLKGRLYCEHCRYYKNRSEAGEETRTAEQRAIAKYDMFGISRKFVKDNKLV